MRSTRFHCADIESLRSELKTNTEVVPVVDYGAGSTGSTSTVSGIAQRLLKRPNTPVPLLHCRRISVALPPSSLAHLWGSLRLTWHATRNPNDGGR